MTREDAIFAMEHYKLHFALTRKAIEAFDMAIKALEQEPCADAISRAEVLSHAKTEWGNGHEQPFDYVEVDVIKQLPPVKPQYTDTEIQKMQDLEFAEIQKAYEIGKAENPNKWIPVSERLPKGSDIVLLSLPPHIDPDGEECFASVICGHYIGGRNAEWGLSDGDAFGYGLVSVRKGTNPVAWMPLPEPYKASPTGAESEEQG